MGIEPKRYKLNEKNYNVFIVVIFITPLSVIHKFSS